MTAVISPSCLAAWSVGSRQEVLLLTFGTHGVILSGMKRLRWSHEKNETLKRTRGVSFEEAAYHIERDDVLDVRKQPNQDRYPDQKIFIIELADYVYLVPFVEDEKEIFLKTIIPSRKAKKEFRDG